MKHLQAPSPTDSTKSPRCNLPFTKPQDRSHLRHPSRAALHLLVPSFHTQDAPQIRASPTQLFRGVSCYVTSSKNKRRNEAFSRYAEMPHCLKPRPYYGLSYLLGILDLLSDTLQAVRLNSELRCSRYLRHAPSDPLNRPTTEYSPTRILLQRPK